MARMEPLEPLPGVMAALHAASPELAAIPQVVEYVSELLDYSGCWSVVDASETGDLELVKRAIAHEQRRGRRALPPPTATSQRANFTAATIQAARGGYLSVFQWLAGHYAPEGGGDVTDAMVRAARRGHLEILQWALQHHGDQLTFRWTTKIMVVAAIEGHFNVVRWLHEHSTAPGSPHVMDCAAEALDLSMLQWLHANRPEGCTPYAMDNAARQGNLEIVQWLHENRSEGCTTGAMDGAAMNGHLEMLKWLHSHRHEGCTPSALHCAAVNGHAAVVVWLDNNCRVGDRTRAFTSAVRWGHLEVVKALAKYCPGGTTSHLDASLASLSPSVSEAEGSARERAFASARRQRLRNSRRLLEGPAVETAVWYGRLEVVKYLFAQGLTTDSTRSRAELAATAIQRDHADVAQWLMTSTS